MAITTEYHVSLKYLMDNRAAAQGAQQLSRHLRDTEQASSSLKSSLLGIGAALVGYIGFHQASKSLIDFNSGLEQAQIQMAGLMAQAGRGTYTSNLEAAATLVRQMQIDSRASVGTTQEFVAMASMLVQPLTMAGASLENIRDMTRESVVASKAMGIAADVAARDVDQAVRGMYRSVDQFSGKLLTPLGYGGEEGRRRFNALTMQQRFAELQRALSTDAIQAMAKGQEGSYAGVMSTFVDITQMTLGRVGMPLFKRLTEELKSWNRWLIANEDRVNHIADVLGTKILQAAISFRDAILWAAEHWKSIAATWAMLKGAGYLASLSAAGGGAGAAGGAAGAAMGFGGKAASVSIIAAAVYIGATELAQWIDRRQDRQLESAGRFDSSVLGPLQAARSGLNGKSARALLEMGRMQGWVNDKGAINTGMVSAGIDEMMGETRKRFVEGLGMPYNARNTYTDAIAAETVKQLTQWVAEGMAYSKQHEVNMSMGSPDTSTAASKGIKVNVTIHRLEVASDDPDRWAVGFTDWVANVARNPTNAMHTIREAT
jgi:hypothetical protein